MKKFFKAFICSLLCISMLAIASVSEAEGMMNLEWDADYESKQMKVSFTSPAAYPQQVTVAIYPSSISSPTFTDMHRITVIPLKPGEAGNVTFDIDDDRLLAGVSGGAYTILVQGNGYLSSYCKETKNIKILRPTDVGNILSRTNLATDTLTLKQCLTDASEALVLTLESDPAILEKQLQSFLEVKALDYRNNFTNLKQVRYAYSIAKTMVYLNGGTATADGLKTIVEANASLLGPDIKEADYVKESASIYRLTLQMKNTYNNGTGIITYAELLTAIEQNKAISVLNSAKMEEIKAVVGKYKDVFKLSADSDSKFLSSGNATQNKVIRLLFNKNFTNIGDVKKEFEDGVKNSQAITPDSGSGGSGGGGSMGGNTLGNVVTGGATTPTTPDAPTTPSGKFSDCTTSHWANIYVEDLQKKGIIKGYDDGSFRPENTVSREEFVKMVISAAGLYNANAECDFDDVAKNAWFYKYAASASETNIINGVSDSMFGTGTYITREDVSVITARIIDNIKKSESANTNDVETKFSDNSSMSDYAKASIEALTKLNVINGFEDGSFKPKALLTRAQAAKIIYMLRSIIG